MKIEIKISQDLETILESQKIRNEVFVQEQGIPLELDLDSRDNISYHTLAYAGKQAVGVGRLALTDKNDAVLARIAVQKEFRSFGIASKIVKASLLQAEKLNISKVDIYPHEYLKGFYESFGFIYIEESEVVGNHQLIKMEKILRN
ncbi:MAG: GNAT family N-acetyltransferase [Desulfobacterales bacterium]|nr:GNAT family N-acetyltransferase [Desulfobacterales bacterium]MCP4163164.1 GNAT family N-acetyltransferase [Deltaproteobacteria bacterium]